MDRLAFSRGRVVSIDVAPLVVPLTEPFVIASARMDTTRAALVVADVEIEGRRLRGYGEAACLHPVTREDLPDLLAAAPRVQSLAGRAIARARDATAAAREVAEGSPVLSAAIECALVDGLARAAGRGARHLLAGEVDDELVTDVTLPIASAPEVTALARRWVERGFTCFKVKVGRDVDHDVAAIRAAHGVAPGAAFRVDANAGFSAADALFLLRELARAGVRVECFEQPCPREDLDAMAKVAREGGVPVVADESLRSRADLEALHRARAAHGVNLKLTKLGGLLEALEVGRAARALGMRIMVGGMVETRLGMTCAANLAAALRGVEYCDLDTAFLLASDPFVGGYDAAGPRLTLSSAPGWGVEPRAAAG
ncbi:MAG: dipeptide epimerase [Myxococcales bacterium]|nr:dipeptide epimerase [Myxococcales bacterium]